MKKTSGLIAVLTAVFFAGCASMDPAGGDDRDVAAQVTQRLAADPATASLRLGVSAEDGVVTLSGRMDNPAVRLRAVSIARSVPGVDDVNDQTVRY